MKALISFALFIVFGQQNLHATGAADIATSFISSIRNNDFAAFKEAYLAEMQGDASLAAFAYRQYEIKQLDKLGFEGRVLIETFEPDDENALAYCQELVNVSLLSNKMARFEGGITLCLNNDQWKVVYAEFSNNAPRP